MHFGFSGQVTFASGQEPPVNGSPLFGARNCIVTPHMAWATLEARGRLMDVAVDNVRAFTNGAPVNQVG